MASGSPNGRLRVGLFEIDLEAGEVYKSGRRVALQEQPFRVLALLLQRPGEIVTRKDLQANIWPADTYVGFDESLNTAIRKLRNALDDSADNPRFVETVPRRGYRFIAPVRRVNQAPDSKDELESAAGPAGAVVSEIEPLSEPTQPMLAATTGAPAMGQALTAQPGQSAIQRAGWRLIPVTAFALLLALAAVPGMRHTAERLFSQNVSPTKSPPAIRSVAVLPLENLSTDPAQDYFAEGMTDQLITDLGEIKALRVISRTSVMQYKGVHRPIPEIARELNVDAIVEGTVLRSGDQVRITAQLVDAAADKELWARSYQGDLHDILALQNNVAGTIAREIRITVTPHEQELLKSEHPLNPQAYENYLLGRYFWNKRDGGGLQKALEHFRKAAEIDPTYAPAYAGLAETYVLGVGDAAHKEQYLAEGKTAAQRALALDTELAEAHTALALLLVNEYDFAGEEREFKLAVSSDPNYATGRHWYGEAFLAPLGRFAEANREMQAAMALDPASRIIATDWGVVLFLERRYDDASEQLSKVIEMDSGFSEAYLWRGRVRLQQHKYSEAIADLETARRINPSSHTIPPTLAYAYAVTGRRSQAEVYLHQILAPAREKAASPWAVGYIYLGLGNNDQALRWFQRAIDEHSPDMLTIRVEPEVDVLRSDQRLHAMIAAMRLPN
jgi:TolB-like protein/DNA-binding winged helix-turn-helix (wHTH) protein/Tfp pilus assembly protein PilF